MRLLLAPSAKAYPATPGGDVDDGDDVRDGQGGMARMAGVEPGLLEITLHTINGLVCQLLLLVRQVDGSLPVKSTTSAMVKFDGV